MYGDIKNVMGQNRGYSYKEEKTKKFKEITNSIIRTNNIIIMDSITYDDFCSWVRNGNSNVVDFFDMVNNNGKKVYIPKLGIDGISDKTEQYDDIQTLINNHPNEKILIVSRNPNYKTGANITVKMLRWDGTLQMDIKKNDKNVYDKNVADKAKRLLYGRNGVMFKSVYDTIHKEIKDLKWNTLKNIIKDDLHLDINEKDYIIARREIDKEILRNIKKAYENKEYENVLKLVCENFVMPNFKIAGTEEKGINYKNIIEYLIKSAAALADEENATNPENLKIDNFAVALFKQERMEDIYKKVQMVQAGIARSFENNIQYSFFRNQLQSIRSQNFNYEGLTERFAAANHKLTPYIYCLWISQTRTKELYVILDKWINDGQSYHKYKYITKILQVAIRYGYTFNNITELMRFSKNLCGKCIQEGQLSVYQKYTKFINDNLAKLVPTYVQNDQLKAFDWETVNNHIVKVSHIKDLGGNSCFDAYKAYEARLNEALETFEESCSDDRKETKRPKLSKYGFSIEVLQRAVNLCWLSENRQNKKEENDNCIIDILSYYLYYKGASFFSTLLSYDVVSDERAITITAQDKKNWLINHIEDIKKRAESNEYAITLADYANQISDNPQKNIWDDGSGQITYSIKTEDKLENSEHLLKIFNFNDDKYKDILEKVSKSDDSNLNRIFDEISADRDQDTADDDDDNNHTVSKYLIDYYMLSNQYDAAAEIIKSADERQRVPANSPDNVSKNLAYIVSESVSFEKVTTLVEKLAEEGKLNASIASRYQAISWIIYFMAKKRFFEASYILREYGGECRKYYPAYMDHIDRNYSKELMGQRQNPLIIALKYLSPEKFENLYDSCSKIKLHNRKNKELRSAPIKDADKDSINAVFLDVEHYEPWRQLADNQKDWTLQYCAYCLCAYMANKRITDKNDKTAELKELEIKCCGLLSKIQPQNMPYNVFALNAALLKAGCFDVNYWECFNQYFMDYIELFDCEHAVYFGMTSIDQNSLTKEYIKSFCNALLNQTDRSDEKKDALYYDIFFKIGDVLASEDLKELKDKLIKVYKDGRKEILPFLLSMLKKGEKGFVNDIITGSDNNCIKFETTSAELNGLLCDLINATREAKHLEKNRTLAEMLCGNPVKVDYKKFISTANEYVSKADFLISLVQNLYKIAYSHDTYKYIISKYNDLYIIDKDSDSDMKFQKTFLDLICAGLKWQLSPDFIANEYFKQRRRLKYFLVRFLETKNIQDVTTDDVIDVDKEPLKGYKEKVKNFLKNKEKDDKFKNDAIFTLITDKWDAFLKKYADTLSDSDGTFRGLIMYGDYAAFVKSALLLEGTGKQKALKVLDIEIETLSKHLPNLDLNAIFGNDYNENIARFINNLEIGKSEEDKKVLYQLLAYSCYTYNLIYAYHDDIRTGRADRINALLGDEDLYRQMEAIGDVNGISAMACYEYIKALQNAVTNTETSETNGTNDIDIDKIYPKWHREYTALKEYYAGNGLHLPPLYSLNTNQNNNTEMPIEDLSIIEFVKASGETKLDPKTVGDWKRYIDDYGNITNPKYTMNYAIFMCAVSSIEADNADDGLERLNSILKYWRDNYLTEENKRKLSDVVKQQFDKFISGLTIERLIKNIETNQNVKDFLEKEYSKSGIETLMGYYSDCFSNKKISLKQYIEYLKSLSQNPHTGSIIKKEIDKTYNLSVRLYDNYFELENEGEKPINLNNLVWKIGIGTKKGKITDKYLLLHKGEPFAYKMSVSENGKLSIVYENDGDSNDLYNSVILTDTDIRNVDTNIEIENISEYIHEQLKNNNLTIMSVPYEPDSIESIIKSNSNYKPRIIDLDTEARFSDDSEITFGRNELRDLIDKNVKTFGEIFRNWGEEEKKIIVFYGAQYINKEAIQQMAGFAKALKNVKIILCGSPEWLYNTWRTYNEYEPEKTSIIVKLEDEYFKRFYYGIKWSGESIEFLRRITNGNICVANAVVSKCKKANIKVTPADIYDKFIDIIEKVGNDAKFDNLSERERNMVNIAIFIAGKTNMGEYAYKNDITSKLHIRENAELERLEALNVIIKKSDKRKRAYYEFSSWSYYYYFRKYGTEYESLLENALYHNTMENISKLEAMSNESWKKWKSKQAKVITNNITYDNSVQNIDNSTNTNQQIIMFNTAFTTLLNMDMSNPTREMRENFSNALKQLPTISYLEEDYTEKGSLSEGKIEDAKEKWTNDVTDSIPIKELYDVNEQKSKFFDKEQLKLINDEYQTELNFALTIHKIFNVIYEKASEEEKKSFDFCPVAIKYCKIIEAMLNDLHKRVYSACAEKDAVTGQIINSSFEEFAESNNRFTIGKFASPLAFNKIPSTMPDTPDAIEDWDDPVLFGNQNVNQQPVDFNKNIELIANKSKADAELWKTHAKKLAIIQRIRNFAAHELKPITKQYIDVLVENLFGKEDDRNGDFALIPILVSTDEAVKENTNVVPEKDDVNKFNVEYLYMRNEKAISLNGTYNGTKKSRIYLDKDGVLKHNPEVQKDLIKSIQTQGETHSDKTGDYINIKEPIKIQAKPAYTVLKINCEADELRKIINAYKNKKS